MFDTRYMMTFLQNVINIASPSGYTQEAMHFLEHELKRYAIIPEYTRRGNMIIRIPGKNSEKCIGFSAHIDTLGAMVRSIHIDGTLRFSSIGSFSMHTVENEYCTIHTEHARYSGTIVNKNYSAHVYPHNRTGERQEDTMFILLDEVVTTPAEVKKLGIRSGNFISFDTHYHALPNGYIKSRHLDNKASVAILFAYLHYLQSTQMQPEHSLCFYITAYEEVGNGAAYIPPDITELIVLDMGCVGLDLNGHERAVSICAKDSSGPYDYTLTKTLRECAEKNAIAHEIDIYPFYGSDGSAAIEAGTDVPTALIGPGVRCSHSIERTHVEGMLATLALIHAYNTR